MADGSIVKMVWGVLDVAGVCGGDGRLYSALCEVVCEFRVSEGIPDVSVGTMLRTNCN